MIFVLILFEILCKLYYGCFVSYRHLFYIDVTRIRNILWDGNFCLHNHKIPEAQRVSNSYGCKINHLVNFCNST